MRNERAAVKKCFLNGKIGASYQWVVVAIIWFSHTIYFLNYMTIGTLAPLIKSNLGLDSVHIGLLSSSVSLGSMVIQIPAGMLADRCGAKRVMAVGLLLVGLSAISVSVSFHYVLIIGLLALLGAGIGGNQSPGSKAIIMWFPTKGRATGMGIKQAGISTGGIVASFLLPALALQFNSWRYPFFFAGLAAIGAAALISLVYRDPTQSEEKKSQQEHPLGSGFVEILRNKNFLLICCIGIFGMATQFAFVTYFVLYASSVLGFPLRRCGLLLALSFLSGAISRVGWGMVSDYLFSGRRNVILILIGIVGAVTMFGLVMVRATDPAFLLYLAAILLGLTGMGWNALYLTRVGEVVSKDLVGTAMGVSYIISNLGAIFAPPLFGHLIDVTGTYGASWLFLGLCMIAVTVLSILQGKENGFMEAQNA